MRNRLKYYFSYFLVIVLLKFLSGCSSSMQKQYEGAEFADEILDSVSVSAPALEDKAFGLQEDSLYKEKLEIFEQRAMQKAEDFAGYLEIISDTSVDEAFRKQAMEMALKQFSSPKNIITGLTDTVSKANTIHIDDFVRSVRNNNYGVFKIRIINTLSGNGINKPTDNNYRGYFILNAGIVRETIYKQQWHVNYEIKRVSKDFGGELKEVWEVYLSDIVLN